MAEVLAEATPAGARAPYRPRVSLIVLNWNGRRHLDACLGSLGALDYPGERLEYSANVSTRDLHPDEPYTIEAFFPNFEGLRKTLAIKPEK